MIVFDLFEQDPNFRKPVEYENLKHYGTANLANFITAYEKHQPVQFDFPKKQSYKLSAQWVDMLGDYYNSLETQADKAQLVYGTLTDYNKTIRLLNQLAQSKLFEKKSSDKSNNPEFKSSKLARLKTQARAKYPAASSDLEAMTADFVDSQDADQQEFEKVKSTNRKQDELLKQITAINRQQDQEIDGLDSDNSNLQKNLQQLQAVNTELAKKLATMAVRKPKDKEKTSATAPTISTAPTTTGNWVPPSAADTRPDWTSLAQPGIPTATPATVGGQPATVLAKRKRRSKAEIDAEKASKAAMAAVTKAAGGTKIKPVQPNIPAAPTTDTDIELPVVSRDKNVIDLFPDTVPATAQASSNVVDLFPNKLARTGTNNESINEANTIPLKSVVQGYNVEYNPKTRRVTVSRGGQVIGAGLNRLNSPKYHLTLINKIIDRAEEDKYPTDIDVRDVALPTPTQKDPAMRAKELEESLRRGESYSARVHFKDGTVRTVTGIPSLEIDLKQYFAKKGRPVDKVEYDFAIQGSGRGPGPERHEPGSGTAVSGLTGAPLPEGEGSWKKETPWTKATGKDPRGEVTHMSDVARRETEKLARDSSPLGKLFKDFGKDFEKMYGSDPSIKEGDVVNINRGGHNAFRDRSDWLDKRDYVQQQLLDPKQRDNYPELKQRLLDINHAGRKLGYI